MLQLRSREEELKSIIRYKQNTVCKPMFYTPDLWIHVQRVTWLAAGICKQLKLSEDISQKIIRRAMFHDDCEIIAGDIATPVKQNWSQKERTEYEEICANAIPILVENYGAEIGDDYEEILTEIESSHSAHDETFLIHVIIEYADKLDAYMETFHELNSGSSGFLSNMNNTFNFDSTCWEYISNRVIKRRDKIEEALGKQIPQVGYFNINQLIQVNITKRVSGGEKYSSDTTQNDTGIEIYDLWKRLHYNHGTDEHISYLYTENITS